MEIIHSDSASAKAKRSDVLPLLIHNETAPLRQWVRHLARPRHATAQPESNRQTASWLLEQFKAMGYDAQRQGQLANVMALPSRAFSEMILVAAHYDSVPTSPGADDNASAVAALLACARACARFSQPLPIAFAAFNCEEDGFAGSSDFVYSRARASFHINCAHILEMVGFSSHDPDSQQVPTGLPVAIPRTGNFLGLLANAHSAACLDDVVLYARTYEPSFPVVGLKVPPGAERAFPVLARSDHVPFWENQIRAVMWTDTAEFRNPHYHAPSDTPETLDYEFLLRVANVLTASVCEEALGLTMR